MLFKHLDADGALIGVLPMTTAIREFRLELFGNEAGAQIVVTFHDEKLTIFRYTTDEAARAGLKQMLEKMHGVMEHARRNG